MLSKQFFFAVATLFGTTVGAGIFALPLVFIKAGFWLTLFYFVFLGAAVLLLNLMYGEVTLRTNGSHRLPGYVVKYLGRFWRPAVIFSEVVGISGALLLYLILGGQFLALIFQSLWGGSYSLYVFIFWFILSLGIIRGLKLMGPVELLLDAVLLGVLLLIVFRGIPFFNVENFSAVNWANYFLPYGIILFAISGGVAIPEMKEQFGVSQKKLLKAAIISGTLLSVLIAAIFGSVVAGITGAATSADALGGLKAVFGSNFIKLMALFGFSVIATSFLVLGVYLKEVFQFDFKIGKNIAALLAVLIPIFSFALGIQSFTKVIGFLGSVTVPLSSLIVVLVFKAAKRKGDREPEYNLAVSRPLLGGLIILFLMGFLHQIILSL